MADKLRKSYMVLNKAAIPSDAEVGAEYFGLQDGSHVIVTETGKDNYEAVGKEPTADRIKELYESAADVTVYSAEDKAEVDKVKDKADKSYVDTTFVQKDGAKVLSDENYTTEEKEKLAGIDDSLFVGCFVSESALPTADGGIFKKAREGQYAYVDGGAGSEVSLYIWDKTDSAWKKQLGASTAETPTTVKQKYESNPDTNAFTDAEKAAVATIASKADKTEIITYAEGDGIKIEAGSDAQHKTIKVDPDYVPNALKWAGWPS